MVAPRTVGELMAQLDVVGKRLEAADRAGAPYATVYRLVVRENALREQLVVSVPRTTRGTGSGDGLPS